MEKQEIIQLIELVLYRSAVEQELDKCTTKISFGKDYYEFNKKILKTSDDDLHIAYAKDAIKEYEAQLDNHKVLEETLEKINAQIDEI